MWQQLWLSSCIQCNVFCITFAVCENDNADLLYLRRLLTCCTDYDDHFVFYIAFQTCYIDYNDHFVLNVAFETCYNDYDNQFVFYGIIETWYSNYDNYFVKSSSFFAISLFVIQ